MENSTSFDLYKKGRYLLLIPIVGILISLVYLVLFSNSVHQGLWHFLMIGMANTSLIWAGCMVIVRQLWKKFPWERHPVKHLIWEIVLILLYLLLCLAVVLYFQLGFEFSKWKSLLVKNGLDAFNTVLITFLISTIHEAYYFYLQWKFNFSKSIQLEKENLQAQLNSLKEQVNPHFLFNSLNSLVGMLEDHPKAERFVLDLSDYLRYVLQLSNKNTVPLREELENLEKYLRLQSIRFSDHLHVQFQIDEASRELEIPPLTLQILAENSIKHNAMSKNSPLYILITSNTFVVEVSNNLQKKTNIQSNGQGLTNIRGRYRFLTSRPVHIHETTDTFKVTVPLLSTNYNIQA